MLYLAHDGNLYRRSDHRPFPRSEDICPERARFIELCWRDPAAAQREREAQRLAYWLARAEHLRRLAELEAEPLPAETEPRPRGRQPSCECGSCSRCRARENMRRLRAERARKPA